MHLLFDLDGTLFQARGTAVAAVKAVFGDLGLTCPNDDLIVSNIGRPIDVFLKNVFPERIAPDEVRDQLHCYERQAIRERGRLFPGIPAVLEYLHAAGHRLSVVSNGGAEYIGLVLESTGINGYFENTYSAACHESKASFIAELLAPDEQAVFIGDSYDDIEAGTSNHIPSIAALYGYGDKMRLGEATFAAESPEEIAAFVNQLDIFTRIRERLINQGRRLVGITGVDTSGKTVFTENFARYLRAVGNQCAVIHLDDFHNPLEIRRSGLDEIEAYYHNAFNYRQLTEELLKPLQANGSIHKEVLCLDIETDKYENIRYFEIDSDTIVLLEGVLLFRPPVTDYLDGKIYLHIDFDEVLRRARTRDVPKYGEAFLQRYIDKYIPIQRRYLEEYSPGENCDIFIDNNVYTQPFIK